MAGVDFTPTLLLSVLLLLLSRTLAIPHTLFPRGQFCENVPGHKAGTPLSHRSRLDLRSSLPSDLDLVDAYPPSDLLPLSHLLPRKPARNSSPPPRPPQPPTCAATASHNCPGAHLWCAEDSNTWILSQFLMNSPANPQAVQNILARAITQIRLHIHDTSDGPVENGLYGYVQPSTGSGADVSTLPLPNLPPTSGRVPSWPQPSTPHGLTLSAANANNHQLTWGVLGAAIQALLTLMWTQRWWGAATVTVFDGENEVGSLSLGTGVPGEDDDDSSGGAPSTGSSSASVSD